MPSRTSASTAAVPDAPPVNQPAPGAVSAAPRWLTAPHLMPFLIFLLVLGIQLYVGAFRSERGSYSDEASHLMNGLVLRDYLREGIGQSPLSFARDYYSHYPKIAPLMWPPLFHIVLACFLLPGWNVTVTALLVLCGFTAWTAWRLYAVVLHFSSVPVALGTVALFVATPAVIALTSSVMVDIVVAAFAMEAAYWLGRFAHSGRTHDGALFGLMTAFACLSKGNGLSAVVAALLLPLSGYFGLLKRPGLYVAATIVVVLAAPPLAIAYRLDAQLGDFGPLSWALIIERCVFFSKQTAAQIGIAPIALAFVGGAFAVASKLGRQSATAGVGTGLAAMVAGAFLFHMLSPHRTSDPRYITLAFAPILGLTALGVTAITRVIRSRQLRWSVQLGVFLVLWIIHAISYPLVRAQAPLGYRDLMGSLAEHDALAGRQILVVSNETGEGSAVVEAAVLHLTPKPTIVRGSKTMASDDWMGAHFSLRYADAGSVISDLEAMHIDYVLLDRSAEAQTMRYWKLVDDVTRQYVDRLELVWDQPADPTQRRLRRLSLYRLRFRAPGAPKPVPLSTINPMLAQ